MNRILFAAALLLSGCATVTPQDIARADFGSPPTNYEQAIKGLMEQTLKDPDSAKYKFEAPVKGFAQDGFLRGGKKHFGYIVMTQINAKNSYGGYTGAESYAFFFSEGGISDITMQLKYGMAKYVPAESGGAH